MKKQKLIIYGVGAMAKTYAMYLQQNYEIVAYTATSDLIASNEFNGKPLTSFEDIESHFSPQTHQMVIAVGYVNLNQVRADIAVQAHAKGYQLPSFVSPSILLNQDFTIGTNSILLDQSSVHCGSSVGSNVFISSGVQIGHDCTIGNNVWINAGVCLGGGVTIGDNTFIGMNATVSHGVTIGENNFIGAATLVNRSTESDKVIASAAGETLPMNSKTFLRFSKVMNND